MILAILFPEGDRENMRLPRDSWQWNMSSYGHIAVSKKSRVLAETGIFQLENPE
jgi:hypothetical protein